MIDFLLLVNYYYKKANCMVGDRVIMKILRLRSIVCQLLTWEGIIDPDAGIGHLLLLLWNWGMDHFSLTSIITETLFQGLYSEQEVMCPQCFMTLLFQCLLEEKDILFLKSEIHPVWSNLTAVSWGSLQGPQRVTRISYQIYLLLHPSEFVAALLAERDDCVIVSKG